MNTGKSILIQILGLVLARSFVCSVISSIRALPSCSYTLSKMLYKQMFNLYSDFIHVLDYKKKGGDINGNSMNPFELFYNHTFILYRL